MGHIVKVEGIEMYATARGHSLECDNCGDVYCGGNGGSQGGPIMSGGYRELSPPTTLIAHATRLGWTGLDKYLNPHLVQGKAPPDLCPVCAAMKNAPYWSAVIHEPLGTAILMYRQDGPLLQRHTVVRPLENQPIGIDTDGWPVRDRIHQPPAVMVVKITEKEGLSSLNMSTFGMHFESNVSWPGRTRAQKFKTNAPLIRLWSWGDGNVYAKEIG